MVIYSEDPKYIDFTLWWMLFMLSIQQQNEDDHDLLGVMYIRKVVELAGAGYASNGATLSRSSVSPLGLAIKSFLKPQC